MIRLGRSFWWMLFLTGVSFLLTRLPWLSPNPIYLRLTVTLLVIIAVSALWTIFSLSGVQLNRTSRETRKQVGEVHTEEYEIVNRFSLPKIWLNHRSISTFGWDRLEGGHWHRGQTRTLYWDDFAARGWYELG